MAAKKTSKELLVDGLLEILDIENEFFKSVNKLVELQLDDVLDRRRIEQIGEYCKENFKSLVKKKRKKYVEFYMEFSENDLADIMIFHKSEAGVRLKQKSSELSNINQDVLMSALNDKNLNILIDKLVSDAELGNK